MKSRRFRNDHGFPWGFALIVSIILLAGCGGGGDTSATSADSSSPGIASDRSSIDFGNQVIGQPAERAVTLASTGTTDLDIGTIIDPGGCFTVSGTCSDNTLAPSETCQMVVRFTPEEQRDYSSSFLVDSNAGSLPISITGSGKGLNVGISNVLANCSDSTVKAKVIVSDCDNNAPVSDLRQDNFAVYLNDEPVAPFSVSAATVLESASVALALDWSNSFIDYRSTVKQKSQEFINLLADDDRAAVFRFAFAVDEAAQPYIDVATGRDVLRNALDANFIGATKPTMLWSALDYIIGQTAIESNDKRAVILLTDGFDDGSAISLQDLITHARVNNVVVFTIGLGTINLEALEELARGTGGIHFNALTTDYLEAIYQNIALILTNQYELTFVNPLPTAAHLLRVMVRDDFGWEGEGAREVTACP